MDRETEWKNEFTNARSHAGVHDVYSESTTTYQVPGMVLIAVEQLEPAY